MKIIDGIPVAEDSMTAVISPDGRYRYELTRKWRGGIMAVWVMLNPSTADDTTDDPTIRRVMGFSEQWGYGGCVIVNLFALRATDPKELPVADDPVGPLNDSYLNEWIGRPGYPTYVAWGANKFARSRQETVVTLAQLNGAPLLCLGKTKAGAPKHPLYLQRDVEPEAWLAIA